MKRLLALLTAPLAGAFLFLSHSAFAQSVQQAGPWAPGHVPMYIGSGYGQTMVQDSGTAAGGTTAGVGLSEMGLTVRGTGSPPYVNAGTGPYGTNWCDYDAPISSPAGYHFLCLGPNSQGGGLLAYGAGGVASQLPLQFIINGQTYQFPISVGGITGPNSSTVGHIATWNNASGSLLADTGIGNGLIETGGVLGLNLDADTGLAFDGSALTLNNFSSSLPGSAPASGGGTTNFLRADGTWAQPTATGTVNPGSANQVAWYASSGVNVSGASLGQNLQFSGGKLLAQPGVAVMWPRSNQTTSPTDPYNAIDPRGNSINCGGTTTQCLQEFLNATASNGWPAVVDCQGTKFPSETEPVFIHAASSVNVPVAQDWSFHSYACNLNFSVTTVSGLIVDSEGASVFDWDGKIVYGVTSPNGNTTTNPSCAVLIQPTTNTEDGFAGLYAGYFRIKSIVTNPTAGNTTGALCINGSVGSTIQEKLEFQEINSTHTSYYGILIYGATSTTGFMQNYLFAGQIHGFIAAALNEGFSATDQVSYSQNQWVINSIQGNGGSSRGVDTYGLNDNFQIGSINNIEGGLAFGIYTESGANDNNFTFGNVSGASSAAYSDNGTCNSLYGPQGSRIANYGSTSGCTKVIPAATASGVLTLPAATDTLVGKATTDTLTNKTISGAANTLSNIGNAALTNSSVTLGGTSVSLGGTYSIPLFWSTAATNNLPSNATSYLGGQGQWSANQVSAVTAPQAMTLRDFYFNAVTAPGAGQNYVITVYTGTYGASSLTASPITCTISGASATSCNDNSHTASLSAGQAWAVQVVSSSSAATTAASAGLRITVP